MSYNNTIFVRAACSVKGKLKRGLIVCRQGGLTCTLSPRTRRHLPTSSSEHRGRGHKAKIAGGARRQKQQQRNPLRVRGSNKKLAGFWLFNLQYCLFVAKLYRLRQPKHQLPNKMGLTRSRLVVVPSNCCVCVSLPHSLDANARHFKSPQIKLPRSLLFVYAGRPHMQAREELWDGSV